MISVTSRGSFDNTERYLRKLLTMDAKIQKILAKGGELGVKALIAATPRDTNLAANSWSYEIDSGRGGSRISWINDDVENGYSVVIGIQYGHGTGTGGYVEGIDFINPAMRPIFEKIANDAWKEVTSL